MKIKQLFTGWLLTFWLCAACAAQATFGSDLATALPPAAIAVAVLLSVIGGAAYTAQKMANPATEVRSVPREIISDVLTSVVVGLLALFGGTYLSWPPVLQAGVITLAGYGGSRVLEPMLNLLINWFSSFGKKPGAPQ